MNTTHAISNSEQNFQIRIPRELGQTFYIPGFSIILIPEIQPTYQSLLITYVVFVKIVCSENSL